MNYRTILWLEPNSSFCLSDLTLPNSVIWVWIYRSTIFLHFCHLIPRIVSEWLSFGFHNFIWKSHYCLWRSFKKDYLAIIQKKPQTAKQQKNPKQTKKKTQQPKKTHHLLLWKVHDLGLLFPYFSVLRTQKYCEHPKCHCKITTEFFRNYISYLLLV